MAIPTIVFNSSTGSDTQASGAGPTTALFGTAASFSGSTVTLDGSPNLSAFDANTWILWLDTDSGRQFFDLSAADDGVDTVTCIDAPAGTATGLTWGIGGKRATFDNTDSRNLFTDAKTGWIIQTETDQAVTSTLSLASSATRVLLKGDSATTHRKISNNASGAACVTTNNVGGWVMENLSFSHTHATTKGAGIINSGAAGTIHCRNCRFGVDSSNKLTHGISHSNGSFDVLIDCEFDGAGINANGHGYFKNSGTSPSKIYGCWFHGMTGIGRGISTSAAIDVFNCLFTDIVDDGILNASSSAAVYISCCTFDQCADGIDISAGVRGELVIFNCIFSNNTNYGIRAASNQNLRFPYVEYNAFYSNTSGDTLNLVTSLSLTNLIATDPGYANADSNNYSPGPNLKAKGFPGVRFIGANQSGSISYVDIGAVQIKPVFPIPSNLTLKIGR